MRGCTHLSHLPRPTRPTTANLVLMCAGLAQLVLDEDNAGPPAAGESAGAGPSPPSAAAAAVPTPTPSSPQCFDKEITNKIEQRLLWARSAVGDSFATTTVAAAPIAAAPAGAGGRRDGNKYEIMGKVWGICAAVSFGVGVGYAAAVAKAFELGIPL